MKKSVYTVELTSSYPEWWRYNLFLSAAEFDRDGTKTGYRNAVDRVYEIEDDAGDAMRRAPEDWAGGTARKVAVTTEPCDHIAIYVYVIANTFPGSALIRDSPPFPAELIVRRSSGGREREVFRQTYDVNQWGGLTIAGLRVDDPV